MTAVLCEATDCRWNKRGTCITKIVYINSKTECEVFGSADRQAKEPEKKEKEATT